MKKPNIYLVEDDENFGLVLQSYLEMNDYKVHLVKDGDKALSEFIPGTYDICILDIMLPHRDGFMVAQEIKSLQPAIPMIFLTAKKLKKDILHGYELGADDYITKPFDSDVLLCKIRAVLNRKSEKGRGDLPLRIGRYTYDHQQRLLKKR